jgi:hypothetical protein
MKTMVFFLVVLLIPFSIVGQDLKALDEKYGFRDIKLETPKSSFENLEEVTAGWYKSASDNLVVDSNITLKEVQYYFYQDQLAIIKIDIGDGASMLKNLIETAYGKGSPNNFYRQINVTEWSGKKVCLRFVDPKGKYGYSTVVFISNKLINQRDLEVKQSELDSAKKII